MEDANLPLLTSNDCDPSVEKALVAFHKSNSYSFSSDEDDIQPIKGAPDFFEEFYIESKKLWFLAGPAIFTSICQYSIGAITQVFAGHVGTIELAAVSVENSVIIGFAFGVMLGMGSVLETLCGQAFGAGQVDMLWVYMQRSWLILNATAVVLMFVHIFATQILRLIGQAPEMSKWAGTFAVWMIPQLFGIPVGLMLGFIFDMSVRGIWYGMLAGTTVQTFVLLWMIHKTNWHEEASIAGDRIKKWGGEIDPNKIDELRIA